MYSSIPELASPDGAPSGDLAGRPADAGPPVRPARWALLGRARTGARRDAEFWFGAAIIALVVLLCLIVPVLSSYSPTDFAAAPYQGPSADHWFGTDSYGRDVFVRVFAGGRVDLLTALVGVSVPLLVGTLIGTLLAMSDRPLLDSVVMRVVDAIMAFPFVILILALVIVFGTSSGMGPLPPGLPALFAAVFVAGWAVYARLARVQTLALRNRDYLAAAKVLGYSRFRIIRRHVLPEVLETTATYAVADAALLIVTTASLPFLGAGVQPPAPEWGNMMYEGRTALANAWWITVFPGLVLAVTGVGISLLADSLIARRGGRS